MVGERTKVRQYTKHLLELAEQGVLSWETIAKTCLTYMSEADVEDMALSDELCEDLNEDEEEEKEEEEEEEEEED